MTRWIGSKGIGDTSDPWNSAAISEDLRLVPEPWDLVIEDPIPLKAFDYSWRLQGKWKTDMAAEIKQLVLIITASRAVMFSPKPGSGNRLGRSIIEQAVTAWAARGVAMLAQVRYDWLDTVGYMPGGFGSSPQIRLGATGKENGVEVFGALDLMVDKSVDAAEVARHIAHLAARYRLAMTDKKSDDEIVKLRAALEAGPLPRPTKKATFSTISLPYAFHLGFGENRRPPLETWAPDAQPTPATPGTPATPAQPAPPAQTAPTAQPAPATLGALATPGTPTTPAQPKPTPATQAAPGTQGDGIGQGFSGEGNVTDPMYDAARRLADPTLSPAELPEIVAAYPALAPQVAAHPNLYPDLAAWLRQLNNPQVNAILATRQPT
ncbi:MAG: hypothetical protein LBE08_04725 [Bifidobacteriaceae bacterium]|jgi:hypothetical protein|nr:hypothetical protein [Bifidobacteriaceae bacterium]